MKCPVCRDPELAMSDRQGIEIDYCPQCRGVWLDRGELDKLIDRSASAPPEREYASRPGGDDDDDRHRGRRRKRGFLGDIFEFGD
jgi:Zn-finger nucleic acid-binding protein